MGLCQPHTHQYLYIETNKQAIETLGVASESQVLCGTQSFLQFYAIATSIKLRCESTDVSLHAVSNSKVHNTNIRLLIYL